MSTVIKLTNLTKTYGKNRGIKDISLEVPKGTIYGFLGPNGAGKTTTISMLVNLLRPTAGKAEIFGKDTQTDGLEIRKNIGYLAGDMALDGSLTGKQQLQYFGSIRGVYNDSYVDELAEKLESDLSKKIKTLSRGNKQKIGLISALMHKPQLLILDEPTSGLDPLIQEQFNAIIHEHKNAGNTTFISSHILSEVQELCDHVAFIKNGRIIANEPIRTITHKAPYKVVLTCKDKRFAVAIQKTPHIKAVQIAHSKITFLYSGNIDTLLKTIAAHSITDISITKGDLEATFMEYYRD